MNKKTIFTAFVALVAYTAIVADFCFVKGVDFMYNSCYSIGEGWIVDEGTNRILYCKAEGVVNEPMPLLDSKWLFWYNNVLNNKERDVSS
jgi:hypothetical protein